MAAAKSTASALWQSGVTARSSPTCADGANSDEDDTAGEGSDSGAIRSCIDLNCRAFRVADPSVMGAS